MVHVPDVVQVEKRIAEEAERAQHFLDPSTESRITRVYVCVVCRCCIWCVLELAKPHWCVSVELHDSLVVVFFFCPGCGG